VRSLSNPLYLGNENGRCADPLLVVKTDDLYFGADVESIIRWPPT
jgi:hypothetical protein